MHRQTIEGYQLSPQQRRLWQVRQGAGAAAFRARCAAVLEGVLDAERLRAAVGEVVRRHEVLRTTFHQLPGMTDPLQVITECGFAWETHDLRGFDRARQESAYRGLLEEAARKPFDLEEDAPLRASLVVLAPSEHVLILTLPALNADAASLDNLVREICAAYAAEEAGEVDEEADEPVRYIVVSQWLNDLLESEDTAVGRAYWRKLDYSALNSLQPSADGEREVSADFAPRSFYTTVDAGLVGKLSAVASSSSSSDPTSADPFAASSTSSSDPSLLLLASFHLLLSRLSPSSHCLVASSFDGRSDPELAPALGLFSRFLPTSSHAAPDARFHDLLAEVSASAREAALWQECFSWESLAAARPESSEAAAAAAAGPAFFPFCFEWAGRAEEFEAGGLRVRVELAEACADRYGVMLRAGEEAGGGWRLEWHYDAGAVSEAEARRLAGRYERVLRWVAESGAVGAVGEAEVLGEEELRQLREWSGGVVEGEESGREEESERGEEQGSGWEEGRWRGQLLHEMFELEAERRPGAAAVVSEGEVVSYGELNEEANRVAHYLRGEGVGPEAVVGVLMERSAGLVVTLLGVLKAGAAYLPLDPEYPAGRLGFMVRDAGAKVVLTQEAVRGLLSGEELGGARLLSVEKAREYSAGECLENPVSVAGAENLVYVIYTSGSTGTPKGAMLTHGGVVNCIRWMQSTYRLDETDRFLLKTSLNFDPSVWEIFWPLAVGAGVVVARPDGHADGNYLLDTIAGQQVTSVYFVPSMLRVFLDEPALEARAATLRRVICGGESLPAETAEKFQDRLRCELHHSYGPTETSIAATEWTCEPGTRRHKIPIGRPLANTQVYVLDGRMRPAPVGVAGELYIGGECVGRGYAGRAALTAERFIPDPFGHRPGARLYRTGDLVRWAGDGALEFLGRLDQQVKVRGYRIELGEIEAALSSHEAVREAVVAAREEAPGERRLVAYVVCEQGTPADAFRLHLQSRLPDYMIPSVFVMLEALPLAPNGKVDRKALPAPEEADRGSRRNYVAPATPAEEALADIWREVLGVERVGAADNFFELGGDSILSVQIVARANRLGLGLTPRLLFQHQTVRELAAVAGSAPSTSALQGPVSGPLPLTPIQRRFLSSPRPDPHHFNQSLLLALPSPLDTHHLASALSAVLSHHDALRLRFSSSPTGRWLQSCSPPSGPAPLLCLDLSSLPAPEQDLSLARACSEAQAGLDLSAGPLTRLLWAWLGGERGGRLLWVAHHLAVDAVSWRILLEDLERAYGAAAAGREPELGAKTTSYKEWAERLEEYALGEEVAGEAGYWAGVARAVGRCEALPVDMAGGENRQGSAVQVEVGLGEEETRGLLEGAGRAYRASAEEVLLAGLWRAVSRWAGGDAVGVEVEGHGREEIGGGLDVTRTVGWFTSVYPVVLEGREGGAGEWLKGVKESMRGVPGRGLGYGVLRYGREEEVVAEELREAPRPQISFNYHGQLDHALPESTPFKIAGEPSGPLVSPRQEMDYLLSINGGVVGGRLRMSWKYSENLYRRETIERLAADFLDSLRQLIEHCQSPEAGGYTPSDFPLAGLDQQTLDRLFKGDRGVEDVYPLSPLQEGLLFHSLKSERAGVYFTSSSCTLAGPLDVRAFRRAWDEVINRHTILRSGFVWRGLDAPVQVVRRRVALRWEDQDWRGLAAEERRERLRSYLRENQGRGFDLAEAPLLRFMLARTGEEEYQFVYTRHHLILDGWSGALLIKEVLTCYESFRRNGEAGLAPGRPFKEYVLWLGRQDMSRAEGYWRQTLKGFGAPTPLRGGGRPHLRAAPEESYDERRTLLPAAATSDLQELARRHQLTLNTLFQGAWALLLSHLSGRQDVLFGTVVSGRPGDLAGAEEMVGMFINTLPLRVRVPEEEKLLGWLRGIQEAHAELRQYEYSPLVQVQGWSEVPRGQPLFESILSFQNYPVDRMLREYAGSLEVRDYRSTERTSYPLNLGASPGAELMLFARYDRNRFGAAAVGRMLEQLGALLQNFAAHLDSGLEALLGLLREADRQQRASRQNEFQENARLMLKSFRLKSTAPADAADEGRVGEAPQGPEILPSL